jgi:hypothetical protein
MPDHHSKEAAVPCPPMVGIGQWLDPLIRALSAVGVDYKAHTTRPVVHEALCCGSGAEYIGMDALQLNMIKQAAADTGRLPRRFVQTVWPDVEHVFESNSDLIGTLNDAGVCVKCMKPCKNLGLARPDMMSAGFPCKPFAKNRTTNGETNGTGQPSSHPAYEALTKALPLYLHKRQPLSFWVEEVDGLLRRLPNSQQTYLGMVAEMCAGAGYHIRALVLNHDVWIAVPRRRVFLIGVCDAAGGAAAVDWIVQKITAMFDARQLAGPGASVWSIVSLSDSAELDLLQSGKAFKSESCCILP